MPLPSAMRIPRIHPTGKLTLSTTPIPMPVNKPIVGQRLYAHAASPMPDLVFGSSLVIPHHISARSRRLVKIARTCLQRRGRPFDALQMIDQNMDDFALALDPATSQNDHAVPRRRPKSLINVRTNDEV